MHSPYQVISDLNRTGQLPQKWDPWRLQQDPETTMPWEQQVAYFLVRECTNLTELDEYIAWIISRKDVSLFPAILENPNTQTKHLYELCSSPRATGLLELLLLEHPAADEAVLDHLSLSASSMVRIKLAAREDISIPQAMRLAHDLSEMVRRAIAANSSVPEHIRILAALANETTISKTA